MQLNLSKYPIPLIHVYVYSVKLNLHIPKSLLNPNHIFHLLLNHGSAVGLVCIKISTLQTRVYFDVDSFVKEIVNDRISNNDIADLVARKYKMNIVVVNNIRFMFRLPGIKCVDELYMNNNAVCLAITDSDNNILVGYRCKLRRWSLLCSPLVNTNNPIQLVKDVASSYCSTYSNLQRINILNVRRKSVFIYQVKINSWNDVDITNMTKYRIYNIVHKNHLKFLSPSTANVYAI